MSVGEKIIFVITIYFISSKGELLSCTQTKLTDSAWPPCDGYAFCNWLTVIAGCRWLSDACAKALANVHIVVGMCGKNIFWLAEQFAFRWNRIYSIEYSTIIYWPVENFFGFFFSCLNIPFTRLKWHPWI